MIKKIFKISGIFLCAAFLLAFPFVKWKNNEIPLPKALAAEVIELWNIDTFEGGYGSRAGFLERAAISYNKQNKNIYFFVRQMSLDSLSANLAADTRPDMVSFGIGAGEVIKPYLKALTESFSVRADLLEGGKAGGEIFAVPYAFGGYTVIKPKDAAEGLFGLGKQTNKKTVYSLAMGMGEWTSPIAAAALCAGDERIASSLSLYQGLSSVSAYEKYVAGSSNVLLGTQRDVYKIQNKVDNGAMLGQSISFLGDFTDLVQYMGVCQGAKANECEKFLNFILKPQQQAALCEIGLFNVIREKYYTTKNFKEQEAALSGELYTINAFASKEATSDFQLRALNYLKGDNAALTVFKGYFV